MNLKKIKDHKLEPHYSDIIVLLLAYAVYAMLIGRFLKGIDSRLYISLLMLSSSITTKFI